MTRQPADLEGAELIDRTADIVSAFVSNNPVPSASLPELIASVHGALVALTTPPEPKAEPLTPIVPIKRTVTPDYIISLEDGRQYKSLKRHLSSRGMTPEEYRRKWSLPADYPMVASSYAAVRSELAKAAGLGRSRQKDAA